jgi:hypothetical protein
VTGRERPPISPTDVLVHDPRRCLDGEVAKGEPLATTTKEANTMVLTITPEARTAIQRVTAHPKISPRSGLRIARREDPAAPLDVRAVPGPRPGDEVVDRSGGRLYLCPDAARRINGRELDAFTDPAGRVQFIVRGAA